MYKVEGKGTVLYFGGSIHLLRTQDYPLPKAFDQAYKQSGIVVLETDISQNNDPEMAQKLLAMTMYQDDRTLKTVLSEDVYKQLSLACANYGIPLPGMVKMKPSMVLITLTMMELQKLGVNGDGVDKFYMNKAKQDNKPMLFLEELEYQMKLITDMGEGNEDEFVLYSLKDLKEYSELFEELVATWRDGTATPMLKQINRFKQDYPKLYQSLLVDRNNNWMPQMEQFLSTPETEFIVAGAMHLHGPDGVLQQLKDKGYTISQL